MRLRRNPRMITIPRFDPDDEPKLQVDSIDEVVVMLAWRIHALQQAIAELQRDRSDSLT